jgi:hypothetical protein
VTVIDSDIFIIAARFPRDQRSAENQRFLALVRQHPNTFATTIFNKLEVMGELSFGKEFERHFGVTVLMPQGIVNLEGLWAALLPYLKRKMALGDALVLMVAESHPEVDTFVTWNAKHFRGKTHLSVLTPSEFLRRRT